MPKLRFMPAIKIALLIGVFLAAVLFCFFREEAAGLMHYISGGSDRLLEILRAAGPFGFFLAMAFLPTFGIPITFFNVSAAPAFAESMGFPLLILCVALSLLVNLLFSYVLIRYLLRPWAERLLRWMGYRLPVVPESAHATLTILLRVTPGPPFLVQNLILGLLAIPLRLYMLVSLPLALLNSIVFIFFTDAIVEGNGRQIMAAGGLLVALLILLRFLRKYFQKRAAEKGISIEKEIASEKPQ